MSTQNWKYIWLGLFAVALWAAIPAFVKIGTSADTLPFLLVLRFGIASLFFLPILKRIFTNVNKIPWQLWLALFISLGANFYFQGLAMIDLPVSWYLVIFCLNPLFALIFLGISLHRKLIIGISLSILGTLLFVNINEVSTQYGIWPFIYLTMGMLTWVSYTVLAKKFQSVYSSLEMTGITQVVSLIASVGIWLATGSHIFTLNTEVVVAVLSLGILTPLAYYAFTSCLKVMPRFSVVSQYLEPVFGILIGFVFFHESFSIFQLIGSAMIVIGSVAVES
jgi:probable blue pigment (indigoidine) exporter